MSKKFYDQFSLYFDQKDYKTNQDQSFYRKRPHSKVSHLDIEFSDFDVSDNEQDDDVQSLIQELRKSAVKFPQMEMKCKYRYSNKGFCCTREQMKFKRLHMNCLELKDRMDRARQDGRPVYEQQLMKQYTECRRKLQSIETGLKEHNCSNYSP
jgi:hypothetical protein